MVDPARQKVRILVVEDENIVALDIERGLKRLGYGVPAVVNNGKDAVQEAGSIRPDLVLMDIQLKGDMDGIAAANEIRNQFNIPVVFLTAYADEATLQRAKMVEPYGYLLKPFEETELHTAIEVVLQKHRAFQALISASEVSLVLSEERFKFFVEAVKDYAIFMMDRAGSVISWNAGAEQIKGYRADEIIGKNYSLFFTPDDLASGKPQKDLEAAATQGRTEEEGWRVRKDGTKFWANIVITALRDKLGTLRGFGKVVRDLTAKKRAEEALLHALKEAQEAVQARDEFLSIASHELKTPLTTLHLQLQLLRRRAEAGIAGSPGIQAGDDKVKPLLSAAEVVKVISMCEQNTKRLSVLIDELLSLTRIRLGRLELAPENVDLVELLSEVISRFSAQLAQAKVTVSFDNPSPAIGFWDRSRIEQVITNLISNAIKYGKNNPIAISLKNDGRSIFLSVSDHGVGIPAAEQEKVFKRFERATSSTGVTGLGLGLYISKQIVAAHGGSIRVESEPGRGSTFTVELPLAVASMQKVSGQAR